MAAVIHQERESGQGATSCAAVVFHYFVGVCSYYLPSTQGSEPGAARKAVPILRGSQEQGPAWRTRWREGRAGAHDALGSWHGR